MHNTYIREIKVGQCLCFSAKAPPHAELSSGAKNKGTLIPNHVTLTTPFKSLDNFVQKIAY